MLHVRIPSAGTATSSFNENAANRRPNNAAAHFYTNSGTRIHLNIISNLLTVLTNQVHYYLIYSAQRKTSPKSTSKREATRAGKKKKKGCRAKEVAIFSVANNARYTEKESTTN